MLYAFAAAYPNPIAVSLFAALLVSILRAGDYTVGLLPLFLTLSPPPFFGLLTARMTTLITLIVLLFSFLALSS
jgi:hypothetical protein